MSSETLVWDVARVGGLLAYVLLTASVAMGIALSLGWRSPRWTRFVTNELHRFVTLVAIVFTGIHTLAVAVDPFIGFTPAEVLVPMLSHYRPIWVALGIVATYLLLAIYASEWVRPRVGYRWWRQFHYLSFAGFVLALVHGVATGSDTRAPWAIVLYAGSIVLVGGLLVARLMPAGQGKRHPVVAAVSASLLVFGLVWATSGPLQAGWNTVANNGKGTGATPQTLAALGITTASGGAAAGGGPTGAASGSTTPTPAPAPTPSAVQAPFQARVAGGDDGSLTLVGQLQGAAGNQFEMQLNNVSSGPLGQVQLQGADGRTCTGPVTQVGSSTVTATCSTGDGASWNIQLDVQGVDRRSVSGTLTATPATQSGVGGTGTGS